ncbi:MAG TPA: DUF3800 domain-containing protein [Candidatus Acidoferrales bacterium]|nr:DUF3800 domain-containing protein [Candidatus Acidoferrales bacterium]
MHVFFIDESGTPPGPGKGKDKYFVIGGVVIPEQVWHRVRDAMMGMKLRRKLRGELKWRYFAPNNDDKDNPMLKMSQEEKNEIRTEMYDIICSVKSIKSMACVACIEAAYEMPSIADRHDLYHFTYKPLSERFQYYLQDLSRTVGRTETGIVVADHRGAKDDKRFRGAHERLLYSGGEFTSKYPNLVESLFFQPSNLSVGVQLADMVAGAVWRKYEKGDGRWYAALEPSLRKAPKTDQVEGFGIVLFPKKTFK